MDLGWVVCSWLGSGCCLVLGNTHKYKNNKCRNTNQEILTQSLHFSNWIRIEVNFSSSQLSPASPAPSLDKSYLREPSQVKLWKCQVTERCCLAVEKSKLRQGAQGGGKSGQVNDNKRSNPWSTKHLLHLLRWRSIWKRKERVIAKAVCFRGSGLEKPKVRLSQNSAD